ncbi:hypothetical protein C8Q73DRAFT_263044 [Cubamyces lactineus]|nr:hypothetical protein C8Q73DRAFT_263044 [Cubamyces lactineus]
MRLLQPAPLFIGFHLTRLARLGVDQTVHSGVVFLVKAEAPSGQGTSYCKEAHELLVNSSLAPKPRYCAYEPGVQMYVIIMDYVKRSQVRSGMQLTLLSHILSLRAAVRASHRQGFVFGDLDLREPNVCTVGDTIQRERRARRDTRARSISTAKRSTGIQACSEESW